MKIHLYLKNGRIMQLDACSQDDFHNLVDTFKGLRNFFTWNDKLWVRKSEVLGFELFEEEKPIPGLPE